ncbi:Protein CBG13796 [Caenorhabditis briggsae]|uniref:Protein CBG13796 n=1 Tax=Caenorhabditis briggsae TaxID=6238 RepID=A8XIQ3_CAEBR|nr:Protein CBG13796 [Caenorhabditis briggsae]CAP32528.2 Protein CBG13796 [Caenorhabditis briggsae]
MSVRETEMTLLQRLGQFEIRNEPPKRLFPLLKLPRVVLVECIENLDVLEIIIFSILSKRAKSIAKFIRWNPLEISLGFIPFTDIRLRSPSDRNQHWKIDDENIYRQPQVPSVCDLIRDDGTIGSVFYGYREKIHDEWICKLPELQFVHNLIRDDGMIGSIFYNYRAFMFQVWRRQV